MAASTREQAFEERLAALEVRLERAERVQAEIHAQTEKILEQAEVLAADLEQLAADDA